MKQAKVKTDFDAVVVGSGPNGLSAAIALQQAGLSVLILEARDTIGGGLRSAELTLPDFVHDICSAIHPLAAGSPFFSTIPLEKQTGDEMAEIKRLFTPEFRNRLDATISFAPLDRDVILRVVDKFLIQLEEQLHEKKVEAHFTEAIKEMLAEKGFDPLMGARPMARLIQDTIRSALADELLFGRLSNGGRVTVDLDKEGKIKLDFEEEKTAAVV
jgi:phytoene dehydrogenase-like protein